MRISDASQQELGNIFQTGVVPAGHFLALADEFPLIFGADGPQREYLHLLLQWLGDDAERDVPRFPKADFYHVSNYFIDWTAAGWVDASGLRRAAIQQPDWPEQEHERQRFVDRFNASHSRLGDLTAEALARDPRRAAKLVQGARKDNSRIHPAPDNLISPTVRSAIRQFAVRRACKFLIYDAIRQRQPIAYALDDLDLVAVVDKTAFELESQPGRFKVPVCTSELREVFRRWDICSPWVLFYADLQRVPPPWDDSRGLQAVQPWAAYAAARSTKLADGLSPMHLKTNMLREVSRLHAQGHYGQAILTYHSAQPSTLAPLPNAVW